jgi:predicted Zn-dependent protease
MSETLVSECFDIAGVDGLAFLIAHELAHISKSHLRRNISRFVKYGDLKKQLFMFTNQYTGFDAVFIEYFTNTRYLLDQEAEADLLAIRVMHECGFRLSLDQYRQMLKLL